MQMLVAGLIEALPLPLKLVFIALNPPSAS